MTKQGPMAIAKFLTAAVWAVLIILVMGIVGAVTVSEFGSIPVMLLNSVVAVSMLRALGYLTSTVGQIVAQLNIDQPR